MLIYKKFSIAIKIFCAKWFSRCFYSLKIEMKILKIIHKKQPQKKPVIKLSLTILSFFCIYFALLVLLVLRKYGRYESQKPQIRVMRKKWKKKLKIVSHITKPKEIFLIGNCVCKFFFFFAFNVRIFIKLVYYKVNIAFDLITII